ncbi:ferrochelatase [Agrilactobacillus fermenti]|uniref:ferrochelatase n=1 Tax=Agrilactobacillus fermenti TaxID=2586909 RepID=UPI001E42762D|nr:ferrochelatase [Agrilactobacillus fermenti]MCD2256727.1 ferrochelatase [Agrilactobacillus fermenti]
MNHKKAILLMAYGTPYDLTDIMAYYTNIRHNHQPTPELYNDLVARYKAIGGTSPLAKITQAQADALQKKLNKTFPDQYEVFVGLKYIHPFIKDAVDQIASQGIQTIYGIPLAPHYSTFSTEDYHNRAKAALAAYDGIKYIPAKSWWENDDLIHFWSDQLTDLASLTEQETTQVIFSAHSLPLKIIETGDPYKAQIEANIHAIAAAADLKANQYTIAWQSAGRTGDQWIGPDFVEVAKDLIQNKGFKHIVSASIGFISDNLEIRYDVDIELKAAIENSGGTLTRLRMPNADEPLINALESEVERLYTMES